MLPVKVENKYKDLIYEQEETNRGILRKRNLLLLYMLHIKHIQLLLYFIYIWYWIGSLYSNFFFSSWDIQTVRCSMSYIYHFFLCSWTKDIFLYYVSRHQEDVTGVGMLMEKGNLVYCIVSGVIEYIGYYVP